MLNIFGGVIEERSLVRDDELQEAFEFQKEVIDAYRSVVDRQAVEIRRLKIASGETSPTDSI